MMDFWFLNQGDGWNMKPSMEDIQRSDWSMESTPKKVNTTIGTPERNTSIHWAWFGLDAMFWDIAVKVTCACILQI